MALSYARLSNKNKFRIFELVIICFRTSIWYYFICFYYLITFYTFHKIIYLLSIIVI